MKNVFVCSNGHKHEAPSIEFGHVYECATCKEVCVKVYPQGGGREWVVIPPETAKFHGLVAHGEPE